MAACKFRIKPILFGQHWLLIGMKNKKMASWKSNKKLIPVSSDDCSIMKIEMLKIDIYVMYFVTAQFG